MNELKELVSKLNLEDIETEIWRGPHYLSCLHCHKQADVEYNQNEGIIWPKLVHGNNCPVPRLRELQAIFKEEEIDVSPG